MSLDKKQKSSIFKISSKYIVSILAAYLVLCGVLYFLMGSRLHTRASKGNLNFANGIIYGAEIRDEHSVEQKFVSKIDRITDYSVTFGTYGRKNDSKIRIELYDTTTSALLHYIEVNTADIYDGVPYHISVKEPISNTFGHVLSIKITPIDATSGGSVAPLFGENSNDKIGRVYQDSQLMENYSLCYSINGIDKVWTGLHYKELVAFGAVIIILTILILCSRYQKGKKVMILDAVASLKKYKFLIKQLISRDFKTKYKRSVLGVLWSFLNPFLTMTVQYFIFSTLFKSDIPHYHIYLLIGIIVFNFFSEVCNMCMMAILGNASLITKVYIPKYIYPFTRALSSSINFLISLIPLFIMIILSGLPFSKSYLLIVFPIICLFFFSLGVGMTLCTSMVFFRDTQFLWNVLNMIWMYATPLFYPITIIPESIRFVLYLNPLYYIVTFMRTCIIDGVSPEPMMYVCCAVFSLISLAIGTFVFKKNQDKFIFNI